MSGNEPLYSWAIQHAADWKETHSLWLEESRSEASWPSRSRHSSASLIICSSQGEYDEAQEAPSHSSIPWPTSWSSGSKLAMFTMTGHDVTTLHSSGGANKDVGRKERRKTEGGFYLQSKLLLLITEEENVSKCSQCFHKVSSLRTRLLSRRLLHCRWIIHLLLIRTHLLCF